MCVATHVAEASAGTVLPDGRIKRDRGVGRAREEVGSRAQSTHVCTCFLEVK